MHFEFNRFSSLLLVFFIHALVYSILMALKSWRSGNRAERWLAFFLLLCVAYIAPWMLGFAGWYDNQPYRDFLFYFPFQHLYLMGPVIFFYVQAQLNPAFRLRGRTWLHLLPAALYLLFSLAMFATDRLILHRYFFLAEGADPDFDDWYQLSGLLSMLLYLLAALRYYRLYQVLVVQVLSNAEDFRFPWIRNFLRAFLLMLVARAVFFTLSLFIETDYWSAWWYYFLFALIVYYIAIAGYGNAQVTQVPFQPLTVHSRLYFRIGNASGQLPFPEMPELMLTSHGTIIADEVPDVIVIDKVHDDASLPDHLQGFKSRLTALMESEKMYENPELNLSMLAKALETNVSVLSRLVNQGFGMNFNDYVNEYRVRTVLALIAAGEHRQQTLLGIAFQAGFNSKATFNRAFRKVTGKTPREYISQP